MAPPKGKLTMDDRTHRMLKRMQFAFAKQFPRCEVRIITVLNMPCLQIFGVVRYLMLECGESKIYALDSETGEAQFLFNNRPKDGDRDRRIKTHDRMWRLFMASEIGQAKAKTWNAISTGTIRTQPQMPTGFPALDKVLEGGLRSGDLVAFTAPTLIPKRVSSYNCVLISPKSIGVAASVISQFVRSRRQNRENILFLSRDGLAAPRLLPASDVRQGFQQLESAGELDGAITLVRHWEVNGQRLHLIVDAPELVKHTPPQEKESDKFGPARLPYKFTSDILREWASKVDVLTVIVPVPNEEV